MKLLTLDTSLDACSVSVYNANHGGTPKVYSRFRIAPRQHAELLLPMIDEVLTEAAVSLNQLTLIALANGPGSFTGIRLATSVVQGLGFAHDLPIVPISTLALLAQSAYADHKIERILIALDARMGDIYWGVYELNADKIMTAVVADCLCKKNAQVIPPGEWQRIGDGWEGEVTLKNHWPDAKDIIPFAIQAHQHKKNIFAHQLEPLYLRDDAGWTKASGCRVD